MRVLVLGSSVINKGAEAMLQTVIAELSDRLPDPQFYIGDARARQWHPEGVITLGVPYAPVDGTRGVIDLARMAEYGLKAPEGAVYWARNRNRLAYLNALARSVDVAVDVSGFLFSDQRGTAGHWLVHVAEMFKRRGTPFVLLPQAFGPFENDTVRDLAVRAVDAATLTYARDDVSRAYLDTLDTEGPVEQAPDIAFLFRPAPHGARLVADLGLDPERPLVAIAPNMRVYERTGGEGIDNAYGRALIHVGRHFLDLGVQVLLVPHEILPAAEDRPDDRYLCGLVAGALGSDNVGAVTTDRPAEELKAMIGVCDMMLGSRFHALIAALSSGVPSVAIGWAHKYPELLGEFGLEEYVFDHDTLAIESLETAVSDVWGDRVAIRASIAETLPDVKRRSSRAFDRTREIVR